MRFKRPISMSFGPDGALYLIEWGTAWFNNKDSQIVRIEYRP
jgi:cytochrome c